MSTLLLVPCQSYPYCLPEPSVKDVDCQMAYQLKMKGSKSTYFPCIGVINCKYLLYIVPYHSHPYCLPEASVKDVDCQMAYQLKMKGSKSTYFPCIGVINCKYTFISPLPLSPLLSSRTLSKGCRLSDGIPAQDEGIKVNLLPLYRGH